MAHFLAIGTLLISCGVVVYTIFLHAYEPKTISVKMHPVEEAREGQHVLAEIKDHKVREEKNIEERIIEGEGDEKEVVIEEEEFEEKKYEPFKFVAVGDSEREKSPYGFGENAYSVIDRARSMRPDFVLFTGDIIMVGADPHGEAASIRHVKNVFDAHLGDTPYYITFGYHDVECGTRCVDIWHKYFFDREYESGEERIAYHSFDHENTHFVILSTDYPTKRTVNSDQLAWLQKDLEQNKLENVIVATHVPPVTFYKESAKDCHDFACQPELQQKLQQIFKNGGVDLVISGHEAVFDHRIVDGIDYILSGNTLGGKAKYKGVRSGQTFSEFVINGRTIIARGIDMEDGILREIRVK